MKPGLFCIGVSPQLVRLRGSDRTALSQNPVPSFSGRLYWTSLPGGNLLWEQQKLVPLPHSTVIKESPDTTRWGGEQTLFLVFPLVTFWQSYPAVFITLEMLVLISCHTTTCDQLLYDRLLKIPLSATLALLYRKVFVISLNLAFHKKWRYTAVVPHQDAWSERVTSSRLSGVTQWNAIKEKKWLFFWTMISRMHGNGL